VPEAVSRAVVGSDTWYWEDYEDGENPRRLPLCVRPDGSGLGCQLENLPMCLGRSWVTDAAKHAHRSCHTDETVCAGLRALNDGAGSGRGQPRRWGPPLFHQCQPKDAPVTFTVDGAAVMLGRGVEKMDICTQQREEVVMTKRTTVKGK
uniref:Uncharacterized protein n=1 Tax=Myotis lucifugus TaxID=59463 RepID=G1P1F2_MYOLU